MIIYFVILLFTENKSNGKFKYRSRQKASVKRHFEEYFERIGLRVSSKSLKRFFCFVYLSVILKCLKLPRYV